MKILVADDNPDLRQIACDVLTSEGYQVISAADGIEALALTRKEHPDLLVLDLSMPRMNGWEVAASLSQDPLFGKLPIIAFTAHALKGDEEKARAAGCTGYVSKPFSPESLLAEVRRLLPS